MWWVQGKCCPNPRLHGEPGEHWAPDLARAGKGFQQLLHCVVRVAHLMFHQKVNAVKSALQIGKYALWGLWEGPDFLKAKECHFLGAQVAATCCLRCPLLQTLGYLWSLCGLSASALCAYFYSAAFALVLCVYVSVYVVILKMS